MQTMDNSGHTPAHTTGESADEVRESPGEGLVGAGELRMKNDETLRRDEEGSGWTSTKQAAKALGVSRRMVQEYVRRGELEAYVEGEGVSKTYYVSIVSLHALRGRRGAAANHASSSDDEAPVSSAVSNQAAKSRTNATKGASEGGEVGEVLRHVVERFEARTAEAAELKVRLELTTQAESTLRESLERERERADRLEAELAALREVGSPSSEPRDPPEKVSETMEGRSRSWWRRFFGFD
jgi:excisionase family DNA binding protein